MKSRIHYRRRGSMYVMVLGTSMAVTVIGLSALMVVRIERRSVEGGTDFSQARFHAQSAIEMGLHRIADDPNWRETYLSGVWEADRPIGNGTYTLEGVDPDDNNLRDHDADPVVLTGIGMQGDARYKLQVSLTAETNPLSCLEVSLHAGDDLSFAEPNTIYGDQIISANNMIKATGFVTVFPAMEAVNGFAGSLVPGTQTLLTTPREMPDPATVFEYYKTNGTWISISSIPTVSGVRTIAENVIGPGYNPYGPQAPQQTNPQGIYVIDCQGQIIQIRDSRIVGTLVLLNMPSGCCIYNSVNWEPAIANYPSLLADGRMDLVYTNTPLSEGGGRNYNPLGAPYLGDEDTIEDDTYPSVIKGLVYISGDSSTGIGTIPITYSEDIYVTIDGVMIVGNSYLHTSNASDLELEYDSTFFDNPPPGFTGNGGIKIVEGSWRQAVD